MSIHSHHMLSVLLSMLIWVTCYFAGSPSAKAETPPPPQQATFSQPRFSEPPLTVVPGDIQRGKAIVARREAGCILCHQFSDVSAPFQGTVGPDLSTVADRLSTAEIRFRIIDSTRINPQTVMPAYFNSKGLQQVEKRYQGRPILNAQEVEDVVAYLNTLVMSSTSKESE